MTGIPTELKLKLVTRRKSDHSDDALMQILYRAVLKRTSVYGKCALTPKNAEIVGLCRAPLMQVALAQVGKSAFARHSLPLAVLRMCPTVQSSPSLVISLSSSAHVI
jgi:hypothetical protein